MDENKLITEDESESEKLPPPVEDQPPDIKTIDGPESSITQLVGEDQAISSPSENIADNVANKVVDADSTQNQTSEDQLDQDPDDGNESENLVIEDDSDENRMEINEEENDSHAEDASQSVRDMTTTLLAESASGISTGANFNVTDNATASTLNETSPGNVADQEAGEMIYDPPSSANMSDIPVDNITTSKSDAPDSCTLDESKEGNIDSEDELLKDTNENQTDSGSVADTPNIADTLTESNTEKDKIDTNNVEDTVNIAGTQVKSNKQILADTESLDGSENEVSTDNLDDNTNEADIKDKDGNKIEFQNLDDNKYDAHVDNLGDENYETPTENLDDNKIEADTEKVEETENVENLESAAELQSETDNENVADNKSAVAENKDCIDKEPNIEIDVKEDYSFDTDDIESRADNGILMKNTTTTDVTTEDASMNLVDTEDEHLPRVCDIKEEEPSFISRDEIHYHERQRVNICSNISQDEDMVNLEMDVSDGDDDENFTGYSGIETDLFSIDFSNLKTKKEQLDEVDLLQLKDGWWQDEVLQRSDSMSSLDSVEMVEPEDPLFLSAASWTSAASSPSSCSQVSISSSVKGARSGGKPRVPANLSANPAFQKPFALGFKREIVYRGTVNGGINNRKMADVYYYTPEGHKIRSSREVGEYLDRSMYDITTANFTFMKEPIGIDDPAVEIIREAKKKPAPTQKPKKSAKTAANKSQASKVPKLKVCVRPLIKPVNVADLMPQVTRSESPVNKVPPIKISALRGSVMAPVVSKVSPVWSQSGSSSSSNGQVLRQKLTAPLESSSKSKSVTVPPCSIRCVIAAGLIPSLQCSMCVCLYHPVCVGLTDANTENLHGYICPNCRQERKDAAAKSTPDVERLQPAPAPPPLMPMPNFSAPNPLTHTNILPQLHRLPQPTEPPQITMAPTVPMLQRLVRVPTCEPSLIGGKVLYSLGNWRPPIAPLQAAPVPQLRPSVEQTSPQSLALMNGKKYIVIPRNNNTLSAPNVSPDSNEPADVNKPFTPNQMTVIGQPPVQLFPSALGPTPLLPKGSILVNQPGGPGQPGGMFLMTPAEPQESLTQQPTQFMVLNAAGTTPSLVAATPSTSAMMPNVVEGAADQRSMEPAAKRPRLQGGFSFTEHLSTRYQALLGVFRFLTVQELLRASRVCQVWRDVAEHRSLWSTVYMKNSRVSNWPSCIAALVQHRTTQLDLRKMLLPKREEEAQAMWHEFCDALQKVGPILQRIDFCRCPAKMVATSAKICPHLHYLSATAITIKEDNLNMKSFEDLRELQGLRLKSFHGLSIENFQELEKLTKIRQLSLTSVRKLCSDEVATALKTMTVLELLELGDCPGLLAQPGPVIKALKCLTQLKRLRLEKLVTDSSSERDNVQDFLNVLSTLPKLTHLELVNFEAGPGCDQAIMACTKLRRLLIVPGYVAHGARTCQLTLRGVLHLQELEHLTWVITNEVIGITRKLARTKQDDRSSVCESEECIPVLSPLPSLINRDKSSSHLQDRRSLMKLDQLEFLPVKKLKEMLVEGLPNTKVTVNKVSYQSTWRQILFDWDF